MSVVCPLYHRGFGLTVRARGGPGAAAYAFRVADRGLVLHTSAAAYRTVAAAERAARRFVDDALGAYERAAGRLAYSSSSK